MTRTLGKYALLAVLAIWFGAIVPGHQRGVIQLPGQGGAADKCCIVRLGKHDPETPSRRNDSAPAPARDPAKNCAICVFTATLDAPTQPLLAPMPTQVLLPTPRIEPQRCAPQSTAIIHHSRAPPALPFA